MEKKLAIKEKLAIMNLRDKGVYSFTIEFGGGGDDGEIEDIEFFDVEGKNLSIHDNTIDHLGWWFEELINKNVHTVGDWINNDGGWGSLEINLETNTYDMNYNQRTSNDYSWDNCELFEVD